MKKHISSDVGTYDNDSVEDFLVEQDKYIQTEARRAVPSNLFSKEVLDLETDELAQNIRIKLWITCHRHSITHPNLYIRTVAYTTAIDMARRHRSTVSLSGDADGELSLGNLLIAQNKGFQDPALEIELEEVEPTFLASLVEAILSLPPRQKHAVLLSIKEHQADGYLLIGALKARGVDIETVSQPEEQKEIYLLRASLSVARKKLRVLRERTIAV